MYRFIKQNDEIRWKCIVSCNKTMKFDRHVSFHATKRWSSIEMYCFIIQNNQILWKCIISFNETMKFDRNVKLRFLQQNVEIRWEMYRCMRQNNEIRWNVFVSCNTIMKHDEWPVFVWKWIFVFFLGSSWCLLKTNKMIYEF